MLNIYDDQDTNQIVSNNIIQGISGNFNVGNSVLILLSPRDVCDHYKRPYVYNFDNNLIENIAENIVSHPSMQHSVKNIIDGVPSINHAILPASYGFNIATSAYSHSWGFVFIIDDNMGPGVINNNISNRRIFIGVCGQEPISQMGLASATPEKYLNPNCQLIITKQMLIRKYATFGSRNYRDATRTTINDNLVHYDQTLWGDGGGDSTFYTLNPGSIHNRVNFEEDQLSAIHDLGSSINVMGSSKIKSSLESPKKQMQDILSAIQSGSQNLSFLSTQGDFAEEAITPIGHGLDDTSTMFQSYVHSAFNEKNINDNAINDANMIDPGAFVNISMLMSNYAPRVFPVNIPQNDRVDIIPQHYKSVNNIFSSLVCSVIPSYMSSSNISEIAFMYNSYHDAISINHIASLTTSDNETLKLAWQTFEFLIRSDLFPILRHNGGEFDLQVLSVLNANTDVILNFLDHEILPVGSIYRENTQLGGITSSLIGNTNNVDTNSVRLNDLIRQISGNAKIY